MSDVRNCQRCGDEFVATGGAPGWAATQGGEVICYQCASATERAALVDEGRGCLYLVDGVGGYEVTDWPGVMRFSAHGVVYGKTPVFGRRLPCTRFYFTGPDGKAWRGRVVGDMDLAHVRRCGGAR